MRWLLLLCFVCVPCFETVQAQDTPPVVEQVSNNKFRRALLKAADSAAKKGELRRVDVIRLRVATLSPAFVAQAEQLAVIQMAFSGEDVPLGSDGKIDVASIDWDALLAFIEKLIPLILQLINLFASMDLHLDSLVLLENGTMLATATTGEVFHVSC
jgi:hypothetical protein